MRLIWILMLFTAFSSLGCRRSTPQHQLNRTEIVIVDTEKRRAPVEANDSSKNTLPFKLDFDAPHYQADKPNRGQTTPERPQSSQNIQLQGGWESSGGDGVICTFPLYSSQKLKSTLVNQNFSDFLLNKISKVHLLDYIEYYDKGFTGDNQSRIWTKIESLDSFEQIDHMILERLRVVSPVLAQKVDIISPLIEYGDWVNREKLEEIEDSNPKVKIPENCFLIQLAVRKSKSNGPTKFPYLKIDINRNLANLLSPLEQVMLKYHEIFYAIAKESNHKDSNDIRRLIALLFSDDMDHYIIDAPLALSSWEFQKEVSYYLGDYYRFFLDEEFYKSKTLPFTNWSRHFSFTNLMWDMRKATSKCTDPIIKSKFGSDAVKNFDETFKLFPKKLTLIKKKCDDEIMMNSNYSFIDTEEKAFIFLAQFHLYHWERECHFHVVEKFER